MSETENAKGTFGWVVINNLTLWKVSGTVEYAACSTDNYTIAAPPEGSSWTGDSGLCLVTKINATIETNPGNFYIATPYESSGTAYNDFEIVITGKLQFAVQRVK
jgi:hypothetical protein